MTVTKAWFRDYRCERIDTVATCKIFVITRTPDFLKSGNPYSQKYHTAYTTLADLN